MLYPDSPVGTFLPHSRCSRSLSYARTHTSPWTACEEVADVRSCTFTPELSSVSQAGVWCGLTSARRSRQDTWQRHSSVTEPRPTGRRVPVGRSLPRPVWTSLSFDEHVCPCLWPPPQKEASVESYSVLPFALVARSGLPHGPWLVWLSAAVGRVFPVYPLTLRGTLGCFPFGALGNRVAVMVHILMLV